MITPGQQKIILEMWKASKRVVFRIQKKNPNNLEKVVEAFDSRLLYGPEVPGFTVSEIKRKFKVYPGKKKPELNKEVYRALKNLVNHGLIKSQKILEWNDAKYLYKTSKNSKKELKRLYMKKGNQTEYWLAFPGSLLGECLLKAERRKA